MEPTRVEYDGIVCRVDTTPTGELYLRLEGQSFPSLPGVCFGFNLFPGTSKSQADTVAAQINEQCLLMFAKFIDEGAVI